LDGGDLQVLSVSRCVILGILLCTGEEALKARVLYDVLQDNMQHQISAGDKDFRETFKKIVEIACFMVPDMLRETKDTEQNSNLKALFEMRPKLESESFTDVVEIILDKHQDEVFGQKSRLSRGEYLLATSKNSPWLFNAQKFREVYIKCLEENNS